jgi:branched-chain amino acid transport system substrate-binding protein
MPMKLTRLFMVVATAASLLAVGHASAADNGPIKIAHIYMKTGLLAPYGQQLQRGLELGFDYATHGTDKVLGRKIEILQMDDQGKAGLTRALFQQAYGDDKVTMAVGPIFSGLALAAEPIAAQYGKIIMPEGVADSITGKNYNPYVVRIARNSSQDAIAQAIAIGGKGACAATLAQDYAFGHDGADAFKTALTKLGGRVVMEEFLPVDTTDFTAGGERVINALKGLKGCSGKYLFVIWAGTANPFGGLASLNPEKDGIHITSGGNILPALALYKPVVGMQGGAYYYYKLPHNRVNDWLVKEHFERYHSPPDFFTCQGFAEAQAIVAAIKKARSTNTNKMIKAFEGLRFESPKGPIYIRPQDHQAMQNMYHFKVALDPKETWSGGVTLKLVSVIKASQMHVPIENK